MSDGTELANLVLSHVNNKSVERGDGKYYPRTSAVGRCIRDMTMHKYGEPWSDPPQAMWGTQFRFDVGHDTEDRLITAMEEAGLSVTCQQMTVEATTPMGLKVLGHMDGIVVVPHDLPVATAGKWYVMDVKSAGQYINGVKVRDLVFEDYEFGGGLIAYLSIERPTKGYGAKKVDLPKVHFTPFEIDPTEVDVYLDLYDEVEIHHQNSTVPGIPDKDDGMVWNGIRCSTRWCQRYSVCQGLVEPSNPKLKEVLHG